ncbi:hypothetical protein JYK14_17330 [Siccirubricoccus sp. KC 17139]|uniref:Yip1 domain-containing protein n=1 Tax=Siccirubricoccus soli TaxID=2899147 RepID=A0ABT1D7K3_9PROT|nr:hypothetical protein [Siccirubricoccus soli]MCO6417911.1 hypothetical protein [Siccirubricoccus soli]MCP2684046.1 hypothetical protein [Siccirubricoccus soli]
MALSTLADVRAWWLTLRRALAMAPHPASRPAASEAEAAAYLPQVLALIAGGQFIAESMRRVLRESVVAPLLRVREWAVAQGVLQPEESWPGLELVLHQPTAPAGLTPLVPPWMVANAFEAAVICGTTLALARLLRPRLPVRAALLLALSALASATLWNMLYGALLFRLEDALGVARHLATLVGPDGAPLPGFEAQLHRLIVVFGLIALLGVVAPLAITLCLFRGLRQAGRGWGAALAGAVCVCVATGLAGVISYRTAFGEALVRLLSF